MAEYSKVGCNIVLIFMVIFSCKATVVRVQTLEDSLTLFEQNALNFENDGRPDLEHHFMDFVKLVNVEKVLDTASRFIDDPEVMRFIGFLFSPKFKDIVWELESMEEFKEAYIFLNTKGYDFQYIINYINAGLRLPQFNKPQIMLRFNAGISGFLSAMIDSLPIEDTKELLNYKTEKYFEVADFVNIIKSPEFTNIIKRMLISNKFGEFKTTFESYGVDFLFVCQILEEIASDDFVEFVCDNSTQMAV